MQAGSGNTEREVVVVSGSSGLIGEALINRLAQNYRVVGLDNVGYPFPPVTAECVCIDITSDKSLQNAFERIRYGYGNKITSVVHLAAYYDFSGEPSPLYEAITVKGTERLLKVLQGFEVEQFIFSSSLLVYDTTVPGKKITEESPVNPKWEYPKSKVRTEKMLFTKRGKIPVVNLRISGLYNEEGNSIPIAHHIQRIYEKRLEGYFYPGSTAHGNPFLHLDDLVDAIVKTVEKRKELPKEITINLGEPETLSYEESQQIISKEIHGKETKIYKMPKPLARFGAWMQNLFGSPFIKPWMVDRTNDHSEIDITRAKTLLNWQPQHSLRETLPKMIASLKADPDKWYHINKLKK